MSGNNPEEKKVELIKNYVERVVSKGNINETIVQEELKKHFRKLAEEVESEG